LTTTTLLRSWWAPACTGPFTKVALHGDGAVTVRSSVVDAVHALNRCLEVHGYRTRAADTGGYNCRRITGGTGYSLHAYGTAIDINWQTNPYGPRLVTDMPREMITAIKGIRTVTGRQVWRWGGDYAGNKDAMHFEIIVSPGDLATGVITPTVPTPVPAPTPDDLEVEKMIWHIEGSPYTFLHLGGREFLPLTEKTFWHLAGQGVKVIHVSNDFFQSRSKIDNQGSLLHGPAYPE